MRLLQALPVQRGRLRDISCQVPDRGESGLHVSQPRFATRRLKERYRLLVLCGCLRKLPLNQSEVSNVEEGNHAAEGQERQRAWLTLRASRKNVPRLGEQLLCPRKRPVAIGQEGGVRQGFGHQQWIAQHLSQRQSFLDKGRGSDIVTLKNRQCARTVERPDQRARGHALRPLQCPVDPLHPLAIEPATEPQPVKQGTE